MYEARAETETSLMAQGIYGSAACETRSRLISDSLPVMCTVPLLFRDACP